jgi:hypothetical protein
MKMHLAASLLAIPLLGAGVRAESPATQPAAALHDDQYFQSLLARLADSNFATREAAEGELSHLTIDDRPALEKLLAQATSEEVKARLTARLHDMDDELATSPSLLALDIHDASIYDVARALSAATRTTINVLPAERPARPAPPPRPGRPATRPKPPGPEDYRFSLISPRISFWDAIRALSLQHPVHFNNMLGDMTLVLAEQDNVNQPLRDHWTHTGSFALVPIDMRRTDIPPVDKQDTGPAGQIDLT